MCKIFNSLKMDFNVRIDAEGKKYQLPSCIQKSECLCFNDLNNSNEKTEDIAEYISRELKNVKQHLYLVQLHENKDNKVETYEPTLIEAFKIRKVIQQTSTTHTCFSSWFNVWGDVEIRLPWKT